MPTVKVGGIVPWSIKNFIEFSSVVAAWSILYFEWLLLTQTFILWERLPRWVRVVNSLIMNCRISKTPLITGVSGGFLLSIYHARYSPRDNHHVDLIVESFALVVGSTTSLHSSAFIWLFANSSNLASAFDCWSPMAYLKGPLRPWASATWTIVSSKSLIPNISTWKRVMNFLYDLLGSFLICKNTWTFFGGF